MHQLTNLETVLYSSMIILSLVISSSQRTLRNYLAWDDINRNNSDINNKFENFCEKVHHTVIEHAPLRKVTPKQLKLRSKQWINTHIQKLIKQRDRLLREVRMSHSRGIEELCKKFRNRVVSENIKSKIKYFEN